MRFKERKIKGVYEIDPDVFSDERGVFIKGYDRQAFSQFNLDRNWVQENHSRTFRKGTIRGFHIQLAPYAETKLVRCIKGTVLNVFIDLRKSSPTFGQWDSIELSEVNRKMAYIPEMFANGFCMLEDHTELIYKTDNVYMPEFERQIIWNDPDIGVNWPISNPILSKKDKGNTSLRLLLNELNKNKF